MRPLAEIEIQGAFNRSFGSPASADLGASSGLPAQGDRVSESQGSMAAKGGDSQGLVLSFPYSAMIRAYLEKEQVSAARTLLEIALRQKRPEPSLVDLQRLLAPARVSTSAKKSADRSDDYQWLAAHGESYRGQWVALSGGELQAHAGSLRELAAILKEQADPRPPLVVHLDEERDA